MRNARSRRVPSPGRPRVAKGRQGARTVAAEVALDPGALVEADQGHLIGAAGGVRLEIELRDEGLGGGDGGLVLLQPAVQHGAEHGRRAVQNQHDVDMMHDTDAAALAPGAGEITA